MARAAERSNVIPPPPDDPGVQPIVADTDATSAADGLENTGEPAEVAASTPTEGRISPMKHPEELDTSRLRSDTAAVGDDVAVLARQAVDAIRQAADAFAARAGVKTGEAVATARAAGNATVDGIGAVAGEARALTEDGIDAIGRSVARNPVTALTIAAGAGLLIGWMTRSDPRR